jgi:hypothetical protein
MRKKEVRNVTIAIHAVSHKNLCNCPGSLFGSVRGYTLMTDLLALY